MASNEKIQPNSHFFTQQNLITAQTAAQSFGPQSTTVFNISSKFSVSAISKAFAICKSVVLVQPQTGTTDKVNLILKPFTQPIQGVNIKYFVYRGLRKSDFFNGNNVNTLSGTSSDFITKIRTDFTSFYEDAQGGEPTFLAKYIGFDTTTNQPGNLLLDDFFNKQSLYIESNGEFVEDPNGFGNFELPIIEAGASLGYFNTGECAIDVVLDWGDYKPKAENGDFIFDLDYARAAFKNITVTTQNTYNDSLEKEKIYQFLDIAAYYGYHTANGTVTIDNAGVKQKLTGIGIYSTLLTNFNSKNKLYLYIQGDRTRSYNFYNNYLIGETSNSLRYGSSAEALTDREYSTNGWPVIIESPTTDTVYLQFVTDNNVNTVLYGQVADIKNGAKNNFSNADDLLLPPNENGELSSFTKVIEITNSLTGVAPQIVGTFNILIYQGVAYNYLAGETFDENNNPVNVYEQPNFIDDVFDLIDATSVMTENVNSSSLSIGSRKLKLVNEYEERRQGEISAVQTLVTKDHIETDDENEPLFPRVKYITEAVDMLNEAISISQKTSTTLISSSGLSGSVLPLGQSDLPEPYYFEPHNFIESGDLIKGIKLKLPNNVEPNKVILGISKTENDLLVALITTFGLKNSRIFLADFFVDGSQFISMEGINYKKYKLGIVGENSNGILESHYPENEVSIYTLDRKYFFSKDYTMYIKEDSLFDSTIDKNI